MMSALRLPAPTPVIPGDGRSKPTTKSPVLSSRSNSAAASFPSSSFSAFIRWAAKPSTAPLRAGPYNSMASGEEEGGEGTTGRMTTGDRPRLAEWVAEVVRLLPMAFPLWVLSACLLGLWRPACFLWAGPRWQIVGLTLTMLGMGMTLTFDDLRAALLMPKELATGFVLQYTVMPLSGYFISKLLKLPPHYAAGLILVACCPGGTSSNIVTYIARGNVALSVLMTAASTFTAAIMTPFLTSKLAGQFVAVDPTGLCLSTVQAVLAPVLLGAALNQYCNDMIKLVSPLMPFVAVASTTILAGSAIAPNASAILTSGFQVVLASSCLHASGFFFGYLLSRMLGTDVCSSRTISIEVGMQNATLGVVLASQHFGNPLTVVPCAVSSICHILYGSALAGIWRFMPQKKKIED